MRNIENCQETETVTETKATIAGDIWHQRAAELPSAPPQPPLPPPLTTQPAHGSLPGGECTVTSNQQRLQ
ncbi:hypothetical protein ACLKA6_006548 [Drosophila palustris]